MTSKTIVGENYYKVNEVFLVKMKANNNGPQKSNRESQKKMITRESGISQFV
jgi:hypothetical protein